MKPEEVEEFIQYLRKSLLDTLAKKQEIYVGIKHDMEEAGWNSSWNNYDRTYLGCTMTIKTGRPAVLERIKTENDKAELLYRLGKVK